MIPWTEEFLKKIEVSNASPDSENVIRCIFSALVPKKSFSSLTPGFTQVNNKSLKDVKDDLTHHQIFDALRKEFKLKTIYTEIFGPNSQTEYLYSDDLLCVFDFFISEKSIKLVTHSISKGPLTKINELMDSFFGKRVTQGKIFLFESGGSRITLKDVGSTGLPLIRDNYSSDVLESLDYIVKELPNKDPKGRLVIFNSEPGLGKSFSLRGIVQAIPDCVFALITPSQIHALTSPDCIPAILELRNQYKDKSIVFIIEDGDDLLVNRREGDMNNISTLLNTSDGILGNMLDFKFIVTTNATKLDIDMALTRPGRLMRHVTLEKLPTDHAERILKRVSGKTIHLEDRAYTLAEIYGMAKEHESNFTVKPQKRVGFSV